MSLALRAPGRVLWVAEAYGKRTGSGATPQRVEGSALALLFLDEVDAVPVIRDLVAGTNGGGYVNKSVYLRFETAK